MAERTGPVDPTLVQAHLSQQWRGDVRAIFASARRFLVEAGASREQLMRHDPETADHGR